MPTASTGGEEGRANTPALRVPPGYVRIDINPATGDAAFSYEDRVITDRVVDMTYDYTYGTTYTTEAGHTWNSPGRGDLGHLVPVSDITWAPNYVDVTTLGDTQRRYVNGSAVGAGGGNYRFTGSANVTFNGTTTVGGIATRNMMNHGACGCELCRQTRSGNRWVPSEIDEEQRAAQRAREVADRERRRREEREQVARRAAADARAEQTLCAILRSDELKHYKKTGRIIVTGSDGKSYLIGNGLVGNVFLLRPGVDRKTITDAHLNNVALASLCCHPDLYPNNSNEPLPMRDAHVGQILYLRHDLAKFYQTANISWYDTRARDEYAMTPWGRMARPGGMGRGWEW